MPDFDITKMLLNVYVHAYVAVIVLVQGGYYLICRRRNAGVSARRAKAGLPDPVLVDHADRLIQQRRQTLMAAILLLLTLFGTPALLIVLAEYLEWPVDPEHRSGLLGVFLVLLGLLIFWATDVAKTTMGGLAYKTLVAFKAPFQIGDRIAVRGVRGKVVSFDSFFLQIDTVDDDRISIPTDSLWPEY